MSPFLETFPERAIATDVTRRVLSHSPELMMVAFHFKAAGAEGARHHHPHVQSTYVLSGRFRFVIAAQSFEVGAGQSFVIPSMAEHGCLCLAPGILIDSFTPRRDDFL